MCALLSPIMRIFLIKEITMNIIFLGAPGSGKGTQAAFLIEKFNLTHLSTGDMLRAEIAQQSQLGIKAKEIMDKGELVSDEIVISMIEKRLTENGALFDGFPRTIAQAEALDNLLSQKGQQIDAVIYLKVAEEELLTRMLARGRADDNEETIKNRLIVYKNQTQPLIEFYQKQGKLKTIEGTGKTIEETTSKIFAVL